MSNQTPLRHFDIRFWDFSGIRCHWEVDAETPELAKQRWVDHFKGRGCEFDDMVETTKPSIS